MKIKHLLTFLLGGFFICFFSLPAIAVDCVTSSGWSDLKINEVYYSESNDWIELYNTNNGMCIDVTGMFFHDNSSVISGTYNTSTKIINPNSWWVAQLSNRLNKTADRIYFSDVLDTTTTIWDMFEYTEEVPTNTAWARIPDGNGSWVKTVSITAGKTNLIPESPSTTIPANTTTPINEPSNDSINISLWSYLRLNEIISNPISGNEGVEIYNPTTSSVDLAGGYVCDNRDSTSTCKILSGQISAQQFLWWDLNTQSYLNNDGDSVRLFNLNNEIIDEVSYDENSAPYEEESLSRNIDGAGEWGITTVMTPGNPNKVMARPVQTQTGGSTHDTNNYSNISTTSVSSTIKSINNTKKDIKLAWKVNVPTQGEPNEILKFSAGLSADPRGGETNFGWDFGSNAIVIGKEVEYIFTTSGIHKIIIFATSTASTTDKYEFNIRIGNGLKWNNTGVKISSILSDPLDKNDQEYISIFNTGSSTINMTGWQLHTVNADKSFYFPEGTNIVPSSTLIFYRQATKLTLNNDGDELELLNTGQEVVDQVKYLKTKKGEVQNYLNNTLNSTLIIASNTLAVTPKISSIPKKNTSYINYIKQSIVDAREKPKNSGVVVNGIVAVEPKIFGVQYFYIADEFGGIQIYNFKKDFPDLKVGDKISVRGLISESSGQKRIKTGVQKDIDILATNNKLESRRIDLMDIGEDVVGALVQVIGDITEIKTNFMYLDDGERELVVYFKQGAKIDKKKFKEGDKVAVTGIVEVSKNDWQLWPRNDIDIEVIGQASEIMTKNQPVAQNTANTYASIGFGAITAMILGALARARGAVLFAIGKKAVNVVIRLIKRG